MADSLKLDSVLDLTAATPLRQALLDRLDGSADLTLDADGVERITTPCIQVLLAAEVALDSRNATLRLKSHNEVVAQAFADLGLTEHYRRWSDSE